MARFRRAVRELDARRARAILEVDTVPEPARLELEHVARFDWGLVGAWFAGSSVVIIVVDTSLALMTQTSPRLGFGWAVLIAFAGATTLGVFSHWRSRGAPAPPIDREQRARALQHELDVAREPMARVEQVEVHVDRALAWFDEGRVRVLVLESGEGECVVLRGSALEARLASGATIPDRWTIEALRWTRSILSIMIEGEPIPVERIELDPADTEDLGECEVRTTGDLPPGLAKHVRSAPQR